MHKQAQIGFKESHQLLDAVVLASGELVKVVQKVEDERQHSVNVVTGLVQSVITRGQRSSVKSRPSVSKE